MAMSKNVRDREFAKFQETEGGETSVRVTPVDAGLVAGKDYNSISVGYPNDTTETYTYSLNVTQVSVITVTYVDNTKCEILTVAYA